MQQTAMCTWDRESAGRLFLKRNLQDFFILSGSSPWPVVEHTKTTNFSSTKFLCMDERDDVRAQITQQCQKLAVSLTFSCSYIFTTFSCFICLRTLYRNHQGPTRLVVCGGGVLQTVCVQPHHVLYLSESQTGSTLWKSEGIGEKTKMKRNRNKERKREKRKKGRKEGRRKK